MKIFNVSLVLALLICLTLIPGCSSDDPAPVGGTGTTGSTGSTGDTGSVTENPVNGLILTSNYHEAHTLFVFAEEKWVNVVGDSGKPMRATFVQDGDSVTVALPGFIINCTYDGTTFTILDFVDNKPANYLSSYLKFDYNGTPRHYLFHKPDGIEENAPLIFMLHGWGMFASEMKSAWYGVDAVADANGFAVCYPQGRPDQDGQPHWNAGPGVWFSPSDDVGFLSALAAYLQTEHNLNPEKTFVAGFSNGGWMTYTQAMDAPDVFKGMASFGGNISDVAWAKRGERPAVFPLLNVIGLLDEGIIGGWGVPHMDDMIAYWVDNFSCADSETESLSANATINRYINCDENSEIWDVRIANFDHDIPRVSSPAGISGAQLAWDFFKKF